MVWGLLAAGGGGWGWFFPWYKSGCGTQGGKGKCVLSTFSKPIPLPRSKDTPPPTVAELASSCPSPSFRCDWMFYLFIEHSGFDLPCALCFGKQLRDCIWCWFVQNVELLRITSIFSIFYFLCFHSRFFLASFYTKYDASHFTVSFCYFHFACLNNGKFCSVFSWREFRKIVLLLSAN